MREFIEFRKIKEEDCIRFFETCVKLQESRQGSRKFVALKDVMKEMHFGRERFQNLLYTIQGNFQYLRHEKGWDFVVYNIVATQAWSKRFEIFGNPVYIINVFRYQEENN